jgi:hypothetical protein
MHIIMSFDYSNIYQLHTSSSINLSSFNLHANLFNNNTARTVFEIPKSTDVIGFGQGIRLPTSGGTQSNLNYYEELTLTMTFTGPFSVNQTRDVYLCRAGKCVTFTVQDCISTSPAPAQGGMIITTGAAIPARFLGANKCIGCFRVLRSLGTEVIGYADILSDGRIRILLQPGQTFGSSTDVGFGMFSGSWTV